jgi:hypothetical protein
MRHSNHVAVLIYRQLSNEADGLSVDSATELLMHYSPTPQLALRHKIPAELAARAGGGVALSGFINALRDFAKQSSFDRFFQSKNSFYLTLVSRNQNPSVAYATKLQKYSGMPIGEGTIVLAPLLQHGPVPGCLPQISAANSWFVITPTTATGPARLGWRTGHANEAVRYALASRIVTSFLKKQKATPDACAIGSSRSAQDDQAARDYILAVISRIEALSSAEPTNRKEDLSLPKRSAALAQELKLFEISRDSYLTLGEFHQAVIQNEVAEVMSE